MIGGALYLKATKKVDWSIAKVGKEMHDVQERRRDDDNGIEQAS